MGCEWKRCFTGQINDSKVLLCVPALLSHRACSFSLLFSYLYGTFVHFLLNATLINFCEHIMYTIPYIHTLECFL